MFEDNVELLLEKLKSMDENFRKRGEWRYPERAAIRRAVGTIKVLLNQVHNLTTQNLKLEEDLRMWGHDVGEEGGHGQPNQN